MSSASKPSLPSTDIREVATSEAPAAIGPYAQAVTVGGFLYTSGQIALAPASGTLVSGGIEAEIAQVLANLQHVLEAAGSSPQRVVKATIYLTDLANFNTVNARYADFFGTHKPARSTVQVAALPKGAQVEIDLVALTQ